MKKLLVFLMIVGCGSASSDDVDTFAGELATPCRQVVDCSLGLEQVDDPQWGDGPWDSREWANPCSAAMLGEHGLSGDPREHAIWPYVSEQLRAASLVLVCRGATESAWECDDPDWREMLCDDTDLEGVTYWPPE